MDLNEKARKKYKWEFLRRNKDYIKDYLKHKDDNCLPSMDLIEKWHSALSLTHHHYKLADPNNSDPELLFVWDTPVQSEFLDNRGKTVKSVSLLSPGSEVDGQKVKQWSVYDPKRKTLEALNQDNYPQWISVSIRMLPHYQSTKAIKIFIQEFKKQLALLLKAQRSIYKSKTGRPRISLYDEYLDIYDLHVKKKWTFPRIAAKYFPKDFSPPKEKSRDPAPENAIRKVRYSYQEAERMIEEGWRYL